MLIARKCLIEQPLCCVCFVIPKDGSAQVGVWFFWLPLPQKSEAALEFWVVLCSFCVVGVFLISNLLIAPMGDSEDKCYQQSYFPLLCLCGFVLFPCSRHTQPPVPVSALKISRGTGLLLQSQGHKKSITY